MDWLEQSDEGWVFGSRISEGMAAEIAKANELGKVVSNLYQPDSDAHECGGCDCCHEKFDIDQKMAEMHDHLLHSICERTGLSEEEVDQKLMEISEVML
ncbi:TPA: hypothetical protein IZ513_001807 [Enterococcus faecium]|uniref:DUF7768 domain-containing protein n=1 Tax=Enterococcus TaxID=1350 RepID=UPI0002829846|nr:hypothetical protein [Enterococcus faecium]HAQ1347476.1 hypothetical protein [Enterococcus faecium Ef_RPH1]HAQ1583280.1 hypothetical protein [Enterococcus faecium Efm-HS0661]EGP5134415.1 hypothetical protein [Enterococcus faecium]EJY25072.1 hypothetical protein HMPREF1355_02073 [Enterococcus faecium 515]ELB78963.1 hypothetical protein OM7_03314 [Enterococcus faecium EnGen0046]